MPRFFSSICFSILHATEYFSQHLLSFHRASFFAAPQIFVFALRCAVLILFSPRISAACRRFSGQYFALFASAAGAEFCVRHAAPAIYFRHIFIFIDELSSHFTDCQAFTYISRGFFSSEPPSSAYTFLHWLLIVFLLLNAEFSSSEFLVSLLYQLLLLYFHCIFDLMFSFTPLF